MCVGGGIGCTLVQSLTRLCFQENQSFPREPASEKRSLGEVEREVNEQECGLHLLGVLEGAGRCLLTCQGWFPALGAGIPFCPDCQFFPGQTFSKEASACTFLMGHPRTQHW